MVLRNIIHWVSGIIGWGIILFSMLLYIIMFIGVYIAPPIVITGISFIGIAILIMGQKNSDISLVDFMLIISIVAIIYNPF